MPYVRVPIRRARDRWALITSYPDLFTEVAFVDTPTNADDKRTCPGSG